MILYATTHGHTEKIADRATRAFSEAGCGATPVRVENSEAWSPDDFDAVVVAGSVHQGHHQAPLLDWIRANLSQVRGRPNAFISVSLTAAEDSEESRDATGRMIEEFCQETGWEPDWCLPVAGALQYREYDFFTRILMKLLMKKGGHPTDTSRDYVYTDWEALDEFVSDVAEGIRSRLAAGSA